MEREEFIKSIVYNGTLVNIGNDDCGQQFFIEFVRDGKLIEVGCGAYNSDYMEVIELELGDPHICAYYGCEETCHNDMVHAYCHRCKYSQMYQDRENRMKQRYKK